MDLVLVQVEPRQRERRELDVRQLGPREVREARSQLAQDRREVGVGELPLGKVPVGTLGVEVVLGQLGPRYAGEGDAHQVAQEGEVGRGGPLEVRVLELEVLLVDLRQAEPVQRRVRQLRPLEVREAHAQRRA